MNKPTTWARPLLIILFLVALAGCGGSSDPYTVSPRSMTFTANTTDGITPLSQTATVTVNEVTYLAVGYNGGAISSSSWWQITGGTTAEIYVYVNSPASMGIGTHTAEVVVIGCKDIGCTQQHGNSPINIDVTYNVTATFSASAAENLPSYPSDPSLKAVIIKLPSKEDGSSWIKPVDDPQALFE